MALPINQTSGSPAVALSGITKRFGDFAANRNVSMTVERGTIHALVGENGAGKSTLMKILYGMLRPDAGEIILGGKRLTFYSPADAIAAGIGMVHQHFMLIPTLTVAENIILGSEPVSGLSIDFARVATELQRLFEQFGLAVDPQAQVSTLSVGLEQRVEILKLLYRRAEILILDEPTAVLTPLETDALFDTLRRLRDEGKTIVIITHKLDEVLSVSSRISVMRQGQLVATLDSTGTTKAELARLMVGRDVRLQGDTPIFISTPEPVSEKAAVKSKPDAVLPEAANISKPDTVSPAAAGESLPDAVLEVEKFSYTTAKGVTVLDNLSFTVRAGEVYGIAGVEGNGQSELLSALWGLLEGGTSNALGSAGITGGTGGGSIRIGGISIAGKAPREIARLGVSHIPEDRLKYAVIKDYRVSENVIFGRHTEAPFLKGLGFNFSFIADFCRDLFERFDVRAASSNDRIKNLSGGNQQKVVVARELSRPQLRLLILAQPTRGVDIGAIESIHDKVLAARNRGVAVLCISAELSELIALSDRIGCLYKGSLRKEFSLAEVSAGKKRGSEFERDIGAFIT